MKKVFIFLLTFFMLFSNSLANKKYNTLKNDKTHINKWNNFVSELYQLHLDLTQHAPITTKEKKGGYGGTYGNKNFYREVSYFNRTSKKLLSKIQWEINNPNTIHTIEVFLYDVHGRVKTDFYARYLPNFRNAPVQTLINLHNYSDQLHAFRQFDANGELIYETCRGKFFNEPINLHLDDHEILEFRTENSDEMQNEAYLSCFLNVPQTATHYLHPKIFMASNKQTEKIELSVDYHIVSLTQKIKKQPNNPHHYLKRGDAYFQLRAFEKAISDYNSVLSIDGSLNAAYFGRGMALARNGKIQEGINDLTIFIKYNPDNSHAYTKRGVRYIWAGKLNKAKQDLSKAIILDITNSEAHDDLGVIYAQQKDYKKALKHFNFAIQNDSSYQKAYHNQAMVYTLTNAHQQALASVNKALSLDSRSRNSLMLKSEILKVLGKEKEAAATMKKAEFLPEENWSEQFTIQ